MKNMPYLEFLDYLLLFWKLFWDAKSLLSFNLMQPLTDNLLHTSPKLRPKIIFLLLKYSWNVMKKFEQRFTISQNIWMKGLEEINSIIKKKQKQ